MEHEYSLVLKRLCLAVSVDSQTGLCGSNLVPACLLTILLPLPQVNESTLHMHIQRSKPNRPKHNATCTVVTAGCGMGLQVFPWSIPEIACVSEAHACQMIIAQRYSQLGLAALA